MRLWLTKLSVVLITFMTFGMFIPPTYLDAEASDQEVQVDEEKQLSELPLTNFNEKSELNHTDDIVDIHEQFISYVSEQAKRQSLEKFGPKIADAVGDEFLEVILPKIEEVIRDLANQAREEELVSFEVSEKPSNGYGEKIFHIFNQQTGLDVARFHVRRVNHPREGHSFNFHYHLVNDQFEQHFDLGDIYWAKNTPPKWMS
ncbi:MAG: YpjP family protein [Anaerobacillus sp.]|uniref:YpjP family protein n=1 Tax=Anaerobacillus sp. TaxID=1872506 RepID=UPI00391BAD5F